jgi:hypothetical protein
MSKEEYDRVGEFDTASSFAEWEKEEKEEKLRQQFVCASVCI